MKTTVIRIVGIISFFLTFCITTSFAENDQILINGVVKDISSKRKLGYANIQVPNSGIGTTANEDGEFTLKVKNGTEFIEISHLGYKTYQLIITDKLIKNIIVLLTPASIPLKEISVFSNDPYDILKEAINRKTINYSSSYNCLTGFYRETIQKRNNYINISEAILNIYKTPYTKKMSSDYAEVHKGRSIISAKRKDTLAVKLQGGADIGVFLDVIKNQDFILTPEMLNEYLLQMEIPTSINEQMHYVISFSPKGKSSYLVYQGKFFINMEDYTISRTECSMHIDDQEKITGIILKKKPYGLRFKPEAINYIITYKQVNKISYLNYVKAEVHFRCDWKRKLFATNYKTISEMVITDIDSSSYKEKDKTTSTTRRMVFSDKINDFYDTEFWKDYNIIEPTISLENAVNKLRKQNK